MLVEELKALGRIHSFEEFADAYNMVRNSGISNVSVDVMYGIPEQTIESFGETLRRVTNLSPEHISLYGLILEEGTPFYKVKDKLQLPTEDTECDIYYLAANVFSSADYSHYEISNYAKEGYECRHNLKYWHCEEYIGVAPLTEAMVPVDSKEDSDCWFYDCEVDRIAMKPGYFMVLYPQDVHLPGDMKEQPTACKKIVGKIKVK